MPEHSEPVLKVEHGTGNCWICLIPISPSTVPPMSCWQLLSFMSWGRVTSSEAVDRMEEMSGARSVTGRGAIISLTIVDLERYTG